jgi:glycosyltransferase involved in cell wall biosynthesis
MGRRRKVLQIFNRYLQYGGEEGALFRIGDAMQELFDVEYFLSSTAEVSHDGRSPWRIPLKAVYNSEVDTRLRLYQEAGRFDVWQIHNIFPIMSPVVYQRALQWGVPVVQYLHNYRFSCVNGFFLNHGKPCQRCLSGNFWPAFATGCWHDSRWQSGWMGLITNRLRRMPLFEKVAQWIALSDSHKREHVRMGIPADRIAVVNHFHEPDAPPLPSPRKPTALFLGRLSVEKGAGQLIEAWKLVAGGERKLLIAGDGPERANLERQAAGVPGISFLGFLDREQQQAVWRAALFSIVPSIWLEPFPLTVMEAWAKGRPVLVNRLGTPPEVVQDGVTGLVAEPGNIRDLAAKLERYLAAPAEAEAMGLAGYQRLTTHFTRQRWLSEISEIYRKIP